MLRPCVPSLPASLPDRLSPPCPAPQFPHDPSRPGAPVTPFTSEPGMLVRRGHNWAHAEDRSAEAGEVSGGEARQL